MSLQGSAFLCIWNDHDPDQAVEYEAWHTFEHVPERVCAPGFLAGRRYGAYERDDSRYLTLYDLESLDALKTPNYIDLQDNPTPWSLRMRQSFRNFLRIPCVTVVSQGSGCAGRIGSLVFHTSRGQTGAIDALAGMLEQMLKSHAVTAYHIGTATEIPAYTVFGAPQSGDEASVIHAVLVEGVNTAQTDAALHDITKRLPDLFERMDILKSESAGFLFNIEVADLTHSPLRRTLHTASVGIGTGSDEVSTDHSVPIP